MVVKNITPKVFTYDELLTEYFQTFGYFANVMKKPLEEVRRYFTKERTDVQIRGEYVRLNVSRNLADDVKVKK